MKERERERIHLQELLPLLLQMCLLYSVFCLLYLFVRIYCHFVYHSALLIVYIAGCFVLFFFVCKIVNYQ